MLEYVERFAEDDIGAKHLTYRQQKNEAESEESKLGLGLLPNNERTWFDYVSKDPEIDPGYENDEMLFAVEFQVSKDVRHHVRSIYSFLAVLGDIGGLKEALTQIASLIVFLKFLFFGNPMHEEMLERLFFRNPKQVLDDGETKLKNN